MPYPELIRLSKINLLSTIESKFVILEISLLPKVALQNPLAPTCPGIVSLVEISPNQTELNSTGIPFQTVDLCCSSRPGIIF